MKTLFISADCQVVLDAIKYVVEAPDEAYRQIPYGCYCSDKLVIFTFNFFIHLAIVQ